MVNVRVALAVPPLAGPRVVIAAPELGVPVTVMVTVEVPAEVGVPEINPVAVLIDKPSGRPEAP